MPVSDSQKKASAKWDKLHSSVLACKVPKEKAEQFKAYCAAQGNSVHAQLLKYVDKCLESIEEDKK